MDKRTWHRRLQKRETERLSARELRRRYELGQRDFFEVNLDGQDLSRLDLESIRLYGSSLIETNFAETNLLHAQLKSSVCMGANFKGARVGCTDLIGAHFQEADFRNTDLTGADFSGADCNRARFQEAWLNNASVNEACFTDAKLSNLRISSVKFVDLDLTPFCGIKSLRHNGGSHIDALAVMKSFRTPGLKQFMIDCGVPEIYCTYMIDCAKALDEPLLKLLMQSTFISYGSPDERFARKLHLALRAHGVVTFFFPEHATIGERIDSEIFRRLKEHDRLLLICSANSLDRVGVLHEIRETLDRESRDGGASYLLPVTLDSYVFKGWQTTQPELAERVGRRIVGDFRGALRSKSKFDIAFENLLMALKKPR